MVNLDRLIAAEIVLVLFLNWFVRNPDPSSYGLSYLDLLPKQTIVFVELVVGIVALSVFRQAVREQDSVLHFIERAIVVSSLIILFLAPFSLLGGNTLVNFFLGVRNYFGFIPMLLVGYATSLWRRPIMPFLKLILLCAFIQVPITIFQFIHAISSEAWLRVGGTLFDVVSGSMGGISGNLLAIILSTTMAMAYAIFDEQPGRGKFALFVIGSLSLPMVLAEAKGGFLFLVLMGVFFVLTNRTSVRAALIRMSAFAAAIAAFVLLYVNLLDLDREIWDLGYYIEYEFSKGASIERRLSRFDAVGYSFDVIWNHGVAIIGGVGLGNATRNSFGGGDGAFFSFYTDIHFWNRLILEAGLVGLGVVVSALGLLWRRARQLYLASSDPLVRGIARGYMCALLIAILAGFYADSFARVQYSYLFGFISGYILGEWKNLRVTLPIRAHQLAHSI
jgi:hypothetical protein